MSIFDVIGDIFGNSNSQSAINKANSTQQQAYSQALQLAGEEYANTAQNELPYITTGTSALSRLAGMYGLADGGTVTANGVTGGVNAGADLNPSASQPTSQSSKNFGGVSEGGITQAQAQYLLQQRPDVAQAWSKLPSSTQGYFGNDVNNYAAYWWNNGASKDSGITLPNAVGQPVASTSTSASPTPASTTSPTYTNATGGQSTVDPNATFYLSPDYNFALQQGLSGLNASYAAQGMSGSGAAAKAAIAYSSGLATQDYQNYASTLKSLAGSGQSAASMAASNNQNYTTTASNDLTTAGNSSANNTLLSAGVANSYLNNALGQISGMSSSYGSGGGGLSSVLSFLGG